MLELELEQKLLERIDQKLQVEREWFRRLLTSSIWVFGILLTTAGAAISFLGFTSWNSINDRITLSAEAAIKEFVNTAAPGKYEAEGKKLYERALLRALVLESPPYIRRSTLIGSHSDPSPRILMSLITSEDTEDEIAVSATAVLAASRTDFRIQKSMIIPELVQLVTSSGNYEWARVRVSRRVAAAKSLRDLWLDDAILPLRGIVADTNEPTQLRVAALEVLSSRGGVSEAKLARSLLKSKNTPIVEAALRAVILSDPGGTEADDWINQLRLNPSGHDAALALELAGDLALYRSVEGAQFVDNVLNTLTEHSMTLLLEDGAFEPRQIKVSLGSSGSSARIPYFTLELLSDPINRMLSERAREPSTESLLALISAVEVRSSRVRPKVRTAVAANMYSDGVSIVLESGQVLNNETAQSVYLTASERRANIIARWWQDGLWREGQVGSLKEPEKIHFRRIDSGLIPAMELGW